MNRLNFEKMDKKKLESIDDVLYTVTEGRIVRRRKNPLPALLIGMTVAQFGMMTRGSCLIIGIDRSDGTYVRPLSLVRFRPYDMVWVAGDKESIDRVIAGAGEHGPKTVRKEAPEHSPQERS